MKLGTDTCCTIITVKVMTYLLSEYNIAISIECELNLSGNMICQYLHNIIIWISIHVIAKL